MRFKSTRLKPGAAPPAATTQPETTGLRRETRGSITEIDSDTALKGLSTLSVAAQKIALYVAVTIVIVVVVLMHKPDLARSLLSLPAALPPVAAP